MLVKQKLKRHKIQQYLGKKTVGCEVDLGSHYITELS